MHRADNTTNRIEVEPYWNVNIVRCTKSGKQHLIEVEPYWNVNKDDIDKIRKAVKLK